MNLNRFRVSSSIAATAWFTALPLSLVSSLAIAPAAHARPAPNCVSVTADRAGNITRTIRVYNSCRRQVRVKIIIAFGGDGTCVSLPANSGYKQQFLLPAKLDGLRSC
ncbi:hypothetical protein [Chamaesiphon minutus]|uniref:Uncharacterized protein n=1 Tax=Chamaesiphon minutus (strain ATCC 27169 / PCC 6605) TaxID=1173020 RepID=K9UEU9_CHAP6|nr:hypothetical protein [Chamaesiphon minutus]AFY92729.1 hypothetical protein Cha6605_1576 [Chamaesiphon minutus PCC 6605]